MSFHEIKFPTDLALGATGGPERRTNIVTLASGFEERNAVWADSRRRYDAGYGIKSLDNLHAIIAFFEARLGRLHGFRWKDRADFKSLAPQGPVGDQDGALGTGDGSTTAFQLVKTYSSGAQSYARTIKKPVAGTVKVALDGAGQTETTDFTVDSTTGIVTFVAAPGAGVAVTAGFEFDVPVRFDSDQLDIDIASFQAGVIPSIPIVEIRL
ncbi:MAG: phage distal tail protein, Rcc01695 family [Alphaproteobacteria bacterium]